MLIQRLLNLLWAVMFKSHLMLSKGVQVNIRISIYFFKEFSDLTAILYTPSLMNPTRNPQKWQNVSTMLSRVSFITSWSRKSLESVLKRLTMSCGVLLHAKVVLFTIRPYFLTTHKEITVFLNTLCSYNWLVLL